jgi:hypothetical protein
MIRRKRRMGFLRDSVQLTEASPVLQNRRRLIRRVSLEARLKSISECRSEWWVIGRLRDGDGDRLWIGGWV